MGRRKGFIEIVKKEKTKNKKTKKEESNKEESNEEELKIEESNEEESNKEESNEEESNEKELKIEESNEKELKIEESKEEELKIEELNIIETMDNIIKKNNKNDLLNKIDLENEEFMILFIKNYYLKIKNNNLENKELIEEIERIIL